MGIVADRFSSTYRDFSVDGVPASGPYEPVKSDIRSLGQVIETAVGSAGSAVARYATIADRDAATSVGEGALAYVYANNGSASDPANGYYQYRNGAWEAAPWFLASFSDAAQTVLSSQLARLAPNLWPEVVSFGAGEFLIDRGGLLGDGANAVILPSVINIRKGPTTYSGNPVQTSTDPTAGHASVLFGQIALIIDPVAPVVIWWDGRSNLYRQQSLNEFVANLTDNPTGAFDKAVVLAVIAGNQVISPLAWRAANDGIGPNIAPWGADVTKAPYRYAATTEVPVTGAAFTSYGLTKAVRGDTDRATFVGGAISAKAGTRVFVRMWLQSNEDNQFGGMGVRFWSGGLPQQGSQLSDASGRVERIFNARERTYTVSTTVPAGAGSIQVGTDMGGASSTTAKTAIAAVQYAVGDGPASFVRLDDWGVTSGASASDLALPTKIFLRSGRPLPFNLMNALPSTDAYDRFTASIASRPEGSSATSAAGVPFLVTGAGTIMLDPARMGADAAISMQPKVGASTWQRRKVGVVVGSGTGAVRLACIGDSKTNRFLAAFIKDKYGAVGGSISTIGTMQVGARPDAPHEGREGWQYADFTYQDTRYAPAGALSPSYGINQLDKNPFIRPTASGDDAAIIRNGYVFDYRRYLTGLGFADPTHVVIMLGTNDLGLKGSATGSAQIKDGMAIMYRQVRAALPNAKIAFASWGYGSPTDYTGGHTYIHQEHIRFVAAQNDSKLDYVAVYLHEDRRVDWPVTVVSTDANGIETVSMADAVHEDTINKSAAAEALLGWL